MAKRSLDKKFSKAVRTALSNVLDDPQFHEMDLDVAEELIACTTSDIIEEMKDLNPEG